MKKLNNTVAQQFVDITNDYIKQVEALIAQPEFEQLPDKVKLSLRMVPATQHLASNMFISLANNAGIESNNEQLN